MQPSNEQLITNTVAAIFHANGHMLNWGETFSAEFGLTGARWQMLASIAWAGKKMTAPRIAKQLAVSRQGAQKQINLLVADGLVEKWPNPGNQRSPLYSLTHEGTALYEKAMAVWNRRAKQLSQQFGRADLETTLRVLNQLSDMHMQHSETEEDQE